MSNVHPGIIYQPPIVDCVLGFIHYERKIKGDEGSRSPGTICPACYADLAFYEIAVAGQILEKDRRQMMKTRERMVLEYVNSEW
jgi:hypothetical protein